MLKEQRAKPSALLATYCIINSYLYQQRKTLAPEKGGDPPSGGEDFLLLIQITVFIKKGANIMSAPNYIFQPKIMLDFELLVD